MAPFSWYSMRIYYYDTNKDALLLDCIRPLFAQLQQRKWVERIYFIRHWQGGSHLRLHMLTQEETFQQQIIPYVTKEVESYLSLHPSRTEFTDFDAEQQYRRRNAMTLEPSVYIDRVPDNTVLIAPYDSLETTLGSQGAAALLEDYYVETNDLVFKILERTRDNYQARMDTCFDHLVVRAATASFLPLERAYMSYRSHVEAYLVCEPTIEEPERRRDRFETLYQSRRESIKRRIKYLFALLQKQPEQLPLWLSEMIAVHRRYDMRALAGVESGEIRLKEIADELLERKENPLAASEFHAAAIANKAIWRRTKLPEVRANRIILNFLYLHLARLGILNEYRYILGYYIASAMEELLEILPVEKVRNYRHPQTQSV